MPDESPLLGLRLADFLDQVAAATPAPAGGAAAAVTVSLAAGLVAMAARVSTARLPDGQRLVETIEVLRQEAARLAEEDVHAYQAVIEVSREARSRNAGEPDSRQHEAHLEDALSRASRVPTKIAEIAAAVACHAVRLAGEGKPSVRGDAVTAAQLADAAARSAAHLVRVNLRHLSDDHDDLLRRATRSANTAHEVAAAIIEKTEWDEADANPSDHGH